jgi:hypothetical protein
LGQQSPCLSAAQTTTEEKQEPAQETGKTRTEEKAKANREHTVNQNVQPKERERTRANDQERVNPNEREPARTNDQEKVGPKERERARVNELGEKVSRSTSVFRIGRETNEHLNLHRSSREQNDAHFRIGFHDRDWWLQSYSIVFIDGCHYHLADNGCWYPAYGFDPSCDFPPGVVYCD